MLVKSLFEHKMKLYDTFLEPVDFLSIYSFVLHNLKAKEENIDFSKLKKLKKFVCYYETKKNTNMKNKILLKLNLFIEKLRNEINNCIYKNVEVTEEIIKIKKYPMDVVAVIQDE